MLPEACGGNDQWRQVMFDGCGDDLVVGVEVAVSQVVSHACDVSPRDLRLDRQEHGIDALDRFADLDESDSNSVECE